jgi:hypothetical protein
MPNGLLDAPRGGQESQLPLRKMRQIANAATPVENAMLPRGDLWERRPVVRLADFWQNHLGARRSDVRQTGLPA